MKKTILLFLTAVLILTVFSACKPYHQAALSNTTEPELTEQAAIITNAPKVTKQPQATPTVESTLETEQEDEPASKGLLNLAIIGVFVIFVLAGVYKGFLWNLAAFGATILSLLIAFIFMHPVSRSIEKNQTLYSAMLSYTEGKEDIYDVDLVNMDIASLSTSEIDEIMERSNLPFPFMQRVHGNIISDAFKSQGITTLGDYFNESKVNVFINIFSFIIIYIISRILLTVLISWVDYAIKFPNLRIPLTDQISGGAIGFIRGLIDISVVFMVTPAILTVLPFPQIEELITGSTLASFLYHSNFLLRMIPGTL